jgi:hypothetical protein
MRRIENLIYLQPQFRTPTGEILNVVSNNGDLLGYLLYMYKDQGDIYVLGHLDEVGEKQNYIDLVSRFVSGLKESCGVKQDPFMRIQCGGEELDFENSKKQQDKENKKQK